MYLPCVDTLFSLKKIKKKECLRKCKKVLNFTDEQKSLIWERFVAPHRGTNAALYHFIEVCETFGLNPILNDIDYLIDTFGLLSNTKIRIYST